MRTRRWSLHEWVSRLFAGAAIGCVVLLAADLFVLIPLWGPRLLKGDPRWETVFFVAKYVLPAAIVAGALAAVIWRRSREIRLSPGAIVGCSLAVSLVCHLLRPVVSRVHRSGIGPLYEVIPDTLAATFCVAAVVVAVFRPGAAPNPTA